MSKRKPEIVHALHDFSVIGQGNRRRNSCYAFMRVGSDLNTSLIRRHPIAAFWALADFVPEGINTAQNLIKSGEFILVEVHLYVPSDGKEMKAPRKRVKDENLKDLIETDHLVPDRDQDHWQPRSEVL